MIQDFSTFVNENIKKELKETIHVVVEDLVNYYAPDYEIDEGLLTKLKDAISGWFEQNIKNSLFYFKIK